jgi:hypothetical protein
MIVFAAVDFGLLGVAGWAIATWVGVETLAPMTLMFGLGFCTRYAWVGGAFLRQDWFAALLIAGAALHVRRFGLAGMALGYASMVRVFPALCLLPLMVHALGTRRRPEAMSVFGRFAAGLAASGALLFIAGGLQGRGFGAWLESARRIAIHAGSTFPNAIGLRIPLITSGANLRGELRDPVTLYVFDRISADYAHLLRERFFLVGFAALTVIGLASRVAYKANAPEKALACGVAVIFALTVPTCYYGGFFVLLAFWQPLQTGAVFLAGTIATYAAAGGVLWLVARGVIPLNGAAIYAPASGILTVVLLVWLSTALRFVSRLALPCRSRDRSGPSARA